LEEPEDIVNEEKDVSALSVTEILGGGKSGETDAETGSWGLVHLAVDEAGLVEHAGILHFVPEVVTFTGTLTDAAENRVATVSLGDIVDELHDNDGLTNARSTEEADLSTLNVRGEEVDDLNTGLEHLL
jgi:peptide chain release factor 1